MSFLRELDAATASALNAADSLDALARRLGSVFIDALAESVRRLREAGLIESAKAESLLQYEPVTTVYEDTLPVPHPGDADWRLSSRAYHAVARLMLDRSEKGLLVLGAPTV
ncbi:MAG TPA: hypothetical protein VME66_03255, partial [Candidatus Acidoferrales bacterium]|nr:hypothetical protein [Candidatus Acidoferrales bacterium]